MMLGRTSENSNFLVSNALLIPVITFQWAHKDSVQYFPSCFLHSELERTFVWWVDKYAKSGINLLECMLKTKLHLHCQVWEYHSSIGTKPFISRYESRVYC
jgi:hypothetical protein